MIKSKIPDVVITEIHQPSDLSTYSQNKQGAVVAEINPSIFYPKLDELSKIANLPISSPEEKKLEKQLSETLNYIENLNEINTESIEPTDHVTGLLNVVREDSTAPSLSQEEALKNTKEAKNGFFKVRGILKNE